MPPANSLAALTPPTPTDLEAHRQFIQDIGEILAGQHALSESDSLVFVYRIPDVTSMERYPRLRKASFGEIQWDEDGTFSAVRPSGEEVVLIALADPLEALEFLSSLRHLIESHRRQLALPANAELERSGGSRSSNGRNAASPGGAKGHLLKEYDLLRDQLLHEHYRQKDRQKQLEYRYA